MLWFWNLFGCWEIQLVDYSYISNIKLQIHHQSPQNTRREWIHFLWSPIQGYLYRMTSLVGFKQSLRNARYWPVDWPKQETAWDCHYFHYNHAIIPSQNRVASKDVVWPRNFADINDITYLHWDVNLERVDLIDHSRRRGMHKYDKWL